MLQSGKNKFPQIWMFQTSLFTSDRSTCHT